TPISRYYSSRGTLPGIPFKSKKLKQTPTFRSKRTAGCEQRILQNTIFKNRAVQVPNANGQASTKRRFGTCPLTEQLYWERANRAKKKSLQTGRMEAFTNQL